MQEQKHFPQALHPMHANKIGKVIKNGLLIRTRIELLNFVRLLSKIPYTDGFCAESADLFRLFEQSCLFELPDNYHLEFGREINKACRDGRLPFRRKLISRASVAAYSGLDLSAVEALLPQGSV